MNEHLHYWETLLWNSALIPCSFITWTMPTWIYFYGSLQYGTSGVSNSHYYMEVYSAVSGVSVTYQSDSYTFSESVRVSINIQLSFSWFFFSIICGRKFWFCHHQRLGLFIHWVFEIFGIASDSNNFLQFTDNCNTNIQLSVLSQVLMTTDPTLCMSSQCYFASCRRTCTVS